MLLYVRTYVCACMHIFTLQKPAVVLSYTYIYVAIVMIAMYCMYSKINTNIISGIAPITGTMAIVTVNSLHCGVTYNITAGGMDNDGNPVGPGLSYRPITTGACPLAASEVSQLYSYI